ncbi:M91 family zinc metallopeptidase [Sodalis ligni]|uniref:NleD-like pathogen effector protein (Putative zinc metallopeptidase) n=1 Tax=Sodalis ligni TaxID=2697027 RepID=A0A4V2Q2I8_9GAMM|nr:M91 family zinc metallopeptidase [Sodalis ligni]TCL03018.1 NleD-like pathogen effector protein (putative zinc metallopeptidase) [Sodalis ligni]
MEKIISSIKEIITDVLIYTPVLSLFMLPITRARNLPKTEDRMREEEYQNQGRELHQLAQNVSSMNLGAPGFSTAPTFQVNTVTQAALAGLYLTHTLTPQLENSLRAGNEIKNQFNKDVFAYTPPLPYLTDNYLPNEEPNDILPIENYPKAPLNVMFLPDHTLLLAKNTRFFPLSDDHPLVSVPSPAPLPVEDTTSNAATPFVFSTKIRAVTSLHEPQTTIAPRQPLPVTGSPINTSRDEKKLSGMGMQDKSWAERKPLQEEVGLESHISGQVVEQADVLLSAMQEQTASKSHQPQAKELVAEPDDNVPEPPVLTDFMHPEEAARQGSPALDGDIPEPPVLTDFMHPDEAAREAQPVVGVNDLAPTITEEAGEPAAVKNPGEFVAPDEVPDSMPHAPLPAQNDQTAPVSPAAENVGSSLAGPASYLLSQVSELASRLVKKTLDGAVMGGGTVLTTGGAAVIEGGAAVAGGGLGVLGGGTALASGGAAVIKSAEAVADGAAAAGGSATLKISGDAAAGGSLAVLTAMGINSAARQEAMAVPPEVADAVPAVHESPLAPSAQPKPEGTRISTPKPKEQANVQPARTAESIPTLAFGGDIAELPALAPNERVAPPAVAVGEWEKLPLIHPSRDDIALPDVEIKPTKADSPVIQPAQVAEAVEIARPAERMKSRPPHPREKAPQSRTPLAKPREIAVQVDVHAPMATPEKTRVGEWEMSPLIHPARGEAEISQVAPAPKDIALPDVKVKPSKAHKPVAVAEPATSLAQEAILPAEVSAGLSITPWPNAPALSKEAIINQCKIRLDAHEEGVMKPYIDSDYYGHVPIYEVVNKDADFSQPAYRHYIEMDDEKVAVKLSSVARHGIKYTLIDESNPDNQYGLAFDGGRWQLQPHTTEEIDPSLLEVITFDMVDPDCREDLLSAPDERGLQWTADGKVYLRIREYFVRIYHEISFINCYVISAPDRRNIVFAHYKYGRFWQRKVSPSVLYKMGLKNKFLKQRSRIKNLLDKAEHEINNNQVLEAADHINEAFQKHQKYEAGSIFQLTRLATEFIKKSVFQDEKVDLATADVTAIQEAWVKNVRLPLITNTKVDVDDMKELFTEVPRFCKYIIKYLHKPGSKQILENFALALNELSTTPMALYGANPRTGQYNLVLDKTRITTKIAIQGNDLFIASVTKVLNDIKQVPMGQKILRALHEKAFTIQPPTMSAIDRYADGRFYAKNSAGGAIAFDPGNFYVGDGSTIKTELWRYRDPAIGLYHELLHIYYNHYPAEFKPVGADTAEFIYGGWTELEEAMITGVSYKHPETQKKYDFIKDDYIKENGQELISENQFRKANALMRGHDIYFRRPYYVKQDKLTPKKIKFRLTYN